MERPMPQLNDLSRSLVALEQSCDWIICGGIETPKDKRKLGRLFVG